MAANVTQVGINGKTFNPAQASSAMDPRLMALLPLITSMISGTAASFDPQGFAGRLHTSTVAPLAQNIALSQALESRRSQTQDSQSDLIEAIKSLSSPTRSIDATPSMLSSAINPTPERPVFSKTASGQTLSRVLGQVMR